MPVHPSARVHESVYLDEPAEVGAGTQVWHFSHVRSGSVIGERCIIGQNVYVGKDVRIGHGCKVQNNVSVYEAVTLEDEVFVGPSAVFTNVINPRAFIERKHEFAPTLVKRGATIGANATVLCGVTVGAYALIGAGAVVTRDVPDYALVIGVPGRAEGWVSRLGYRMETDERGYAQCPQSGERYRLEGGRLIPLEG